MWQDLSLSLSRDICHYITNIVSASEMEVDGLFGSAQLHPVLAVDAALRCSLSAVAPPLPVAYVFPPEPWKRAEHAHFMIKLRLAMF